MRKILIQIHGNRNSGFTIIELLIVIVIIGILSAIVITSYIGTQQRAQNAAIISSVNQWETTLRLYKASTGAFPKGNLDYVCLGKNYPTSPPYDANQCAKMPTWGVSVDSGMLDSIHSTTSVNIPDSILPNIDFVNMSAETEHYRGILYLSRNNGFGITYMLSGNGADCAIGDSFFESQGTIACRRVLEGDPYSGL